MDPPVLLFEPAKLGTVSGQAVIEIIDFFSLESL